LARAGFLFEVSSGDGKSSTMMSVRGRCSARSAGVVVLACSAASWVALVTSFVSPSPTLPQSVRDRGVPGHQATFQKFGMEEPRPEPVHWASWVPAVAFAVVFALTMASTQVRAEDNVQINVLSKEERLQAQKERMIQESNSLASDFATKPRDKEGGEATVLGSKKKSSRPKAKEGLPKEVEATTPAKSVAAPEPDVPKKKKVIISPADEIDPDELGVDAPNPPALFAVIFGPATLFLIFWFLGSLDII